MCTAPVSGNAQRLARAPRRRSSPRPRPSAIDDESFAPPFDVAAVLEGIRIAQTVALLDARPSTAVVNGANCVAQPVEAAVGPPPEAPRTATREAWVMLRNFALAQYQGGAFRCRGKLQVMRLRRGSPSRRHASSMQQSR